MRAELFYNPLLLTERLGQWASELRRRRRLRGTTAGWLESSNIDSLELLEILRKKPPEVIFDIGANVGTWTLLAKAIFPEAKVHAFEPLESHHAPFNHITAELADVHLHKVALGDSRGKRMIRVTNSSDASSILPLSKSGQNQWGLREIAEQQIQIEKLDEYRVEQALPFPSLIKLDVQGFELDVLRGAGSTLEQTNAIISEVSFQEFYEGQCLFHEVIELLNKHGLTVFAFGHSAVTGCPLAQIDVLFLKKEIGMLCR